MALFLGLEGSVASNVVRVLLVEDDMELSRAVARRLGQDGLQVVATPSRGAVDALTCCFEIGIFDVDLPDADGTELASDLLAEGRIDHAVFFSASTFQPCIDRALRIGPMVSKRDGVEALLPAVRAILGPPAPKHSQVVRSDRRRGPARRVG